MFIFWLGYIVDRDLMHTVTCSVQRSVRQQKEKEKKQPKLKQKLCQMIYLNISAQVLDEHFIYMAIRSYVLNNLTIKVIPTYKK